MKELLKKHKKSIIWFCLIGIILIPLLIHIAFKTNAPIDFLVAVWDAGDVLAFYGVLIGSFATVWGVYLSIEYARSNYKEDVKNRVLPFIALTKLRAKSKYNFMGSECFDKTENKEPENIYEEYIMDKVYFVIDNGCVEAKSSLTKHQVSNVQHGGGSWQTIAEGAMAFVYTDLLSVPIEIENVGNGVANNFRVGLNPENIDIEHRRYVVPMPLKVGQKLYIHIYCDVEKGDLGTYELEAIYEDVYKNTYRQRYALVIAEINGAIQSMLNIDGDQEPFSFNESK